MHKLDLERIHGMLRDYIFDLDKCKTPQQLREELKRLRDDLCNPVDGINDFERNQHRD